MNRNRKTSLKVDSSHGNVTNLFEKECCTTTLLAKLHASLYSPVQLYLWINLEQLPTLSALRDNFDGPPLVSIYILLTPS